MLHAYVPHLGGLAPLPEGADLAVARWVDLYRPLDGQVRRMRRFGIDIPTLEDMEEIEISNRLYREGEALYMTAVLPGDLPDGRPVAMPVTFILTPDRLVTVRHHNPRPFATFPTRADRSVSGVVSSDHIFLGLMEEIVARLADILEGIGHALDDTVGRVFGGGTQTGDATLRQALIESGRKSELMARVRLGLLSVERVLSFHTASTTPHEHSDALRALAKSINRDVQALEVHADFLGARLSMAVDATLGLINLQQNNTVRVLSVVAALFLPPTMIASIYGMNFDNMPELHWAMGYPMALAAMLISALGIYLLARWKRWL